MVADNPLWIARVGHLHLCSHSFRQRG
jgi:hypothetical protein